MILTKIVPYASVPYADHVLRELGVNPNDKADSEQHIDLLIQAAKDIRALVASMETMADIKGFITFADEEKKEDKNPNPEPSEDGEEKKEKNITELKKEAGDKILNAQGEDIMEKFEGKVLKEFVPYQLLA